MQPGPHPCSVEELLAHASWLQRLAKTLVAGEEAAEDLTQATWLAALRHPPLSAGSPRPWLARIARNLSSNFRRGEARRHEHESGARPRDTELDPSAVAEEVEAQRVLAGAVLRLDEPLRTAVVLRYLRGLDSGAIAREQGVPAGTVRWRLKRALECLRADLDRRFGERRAWCSAFATLARRGAGTSAVPGAPLASATLKLGATAALGAAGVLALAGAWWITVGSEPRSAALTLAESDLEDARAEDEGLELVPPALADESAGAPRSARVQQLSAASAAARASGSRRSAPVRGQLRIANTEEVLDEALTIRLRTGDLKVKETVKSSANGSFTSKRPFPRGFVLAEVLGPSGEAACDCEGFFDPNSDEDMVLSVPWPNFVRGRLVDPAGRPLKDIEIHLLQSKIEHGLDRGSPKEGVFSVTGLGLGPCTVIVRRGFERHAFSTTVARGPNELDDVIVPFRERVGPIRGRLRSAYGNPNGNLVLTDLASGVTYQTEAGGDSKGGAEFEFEEVPLGNYRLTLFAYDGLRYADRTRFVRPPATDIEFVAVGESRPLQFRALDGENELGAEARVLIAGNWCSLDLSCEPADVERWVLVAENHRPASGRTVESTQVDVRPEPGWGCTLFFKEGSGGAYPEEKGALSGVEVRADGVLVARSDADGVALVSLPHEPGKLECSLDGWVMEDDETESLGDRPFACSVLRRE
jgi:RNA polymerase sigma factor (sigma-70 family)